MQRFGRSRDERRTGRGQLTLGAFLALALCAHATCFGAEFTYPDDFPPDAALQDAVDDDRVVDGDTIHVVAYGPHRPFLPIDLGAKRVTVTGSRSFRGWPVIRGDRTRTDAWPAAAADRASRNVVAVNRGSALESFHIELDYDGLADESDVTYRAVWCGAGGGALRGCTIRALGRWTASSLVEVSAGAEDANFLGCSVDTSGAVAGDEVEIDATSHVVFIGADAQAVFRCSFDGGAHRDRDVLHLAGPRRVVLEGCRFDSETPAHRVVALAGGAAVDAELIARGCTFGGLSGAYLRHVIHILDDGATTTWNVEIDRSEFGRLSGHEADTLRLLSIDRTATIRCVNTVFYWQSGFDPRWGRPGMNGAVRIGPSADGVELELVHCNVLDRSVAPRNRWIELDGARGVVLRFTNSIFAPRFAVDPLPPSAGLVFDASEEPMSSDELRVETIASIRRLGPCSTDPDDEGRACLEGDDGFLDVDPLLWGGAHVGPGSPAIDAAVDVGVADDFHGESRPRGDAPDIGVDETDGGGPWFLRADCNGDVNHMAQVGDAVFLLNYNFTGGPEPPCFAACDSNADGSLAGVTDAVYLLAFNFLGGPATPPPFPECGPSLFESDLRLGCENPPACR